MKELLAALARAGVSDADASALRRALYSTDASLYRVAPAAVVRPRHVDEIVATAAVCRELGVPLTMRGAGTSIAGNAIGPGVVLDTSRYLDRVGHIDVQARTATVEPGVVQARLQAAAAPHGLRFGPDPSTHNRCTIGGMIGNNACGSRALAYGRTCDNVLALDIVTGAGERLHVGAGQPVPAVLTPLRDLVAGHLATIRTEFGRFGRQNSGYSLEHLLPERGFDIARFLAGTEGTLAIVLGATVRLVTDPPSRALVVLGYPGMAEAADAAPGLLSFHPTACEGLDTRIVDPLRARPGHRVPPLPRGQGFLLVELVGQTEAEVETAARRLAERARADGAIDTMVVTDPGHAAALWRIREDGAGLAARTPDGRPAHAGWEDAAVPPARLGAYLRDFDALLAEHGLTGVPYGHFGDGCVHVRLDFPLAEPDGPGRFGSFLDDAAALVAGYGGSLSGEHGDGRARGALLPAMYSPAAIDLFGQVKAVFDPENLLNPGVLVAPVSPASDLRLATARPVRAGLAHAFSHDAGSLTAAVHRCTGVGACRADTSASGGVMCPSYQATREEKDTTRGRARVLQEAVNARGLVHGWRAPELVEALDLCLSCKGCARDCPTGVDMAAYKAEWLYHRYRHRPRPRSHYALGWLPRWAALASRLPRLANGVLAAPGLGSLARWAAGIDQRRSLPAFARQTFRQWWAARPGNLPNRTSRPPVVLWVDTFTNYFTPRVGIAAVRVLEDAGYRVELSAEGTCCGLTWISTGQLDTARRKLAVTADALAPHVAAGTPIVGLEPSCTAVLRSDIVELLDDSRAAAVAGATRTLAELLSATPGWAPPSLAGVEVVAQPHCHQHAVMGWETDAGLLAEAGARVDQLGGCCGLAGNWGVERGHHEVSVAVAEHQLLPAARGAGADVVLLADGFSCRTQLDDLAGRPGWHLAELLAAPPVSGPRPARGARPAPRAPRPTRG